LKKTNKTPIQTHRVIKKVNRMMDSNGLILSMFNDFNGFAVHQGVGDLPISRIEDSLISAGRGPHLHGRFPLLEIVDVAQSVGFDLLQGKFDHLQIDRRHALGFEI